MRRGIVLSLAAVAIGIFSAAVRVLLPAEQPQVVIAAAPVIVREATLGGNTRYQAEDVSLESDRSRVVFMGDSITDYWNKPSSGKFFSNRHFVNRGIAGETSSEMLLRFRRDVINLHPSTVVLLAGTNDLTLPRASATQVEENLQTMSELARGHGARVVIASLLPLGQGKASDGRYAHPEQIFEINKWAKSYCKEIGCTYLDYFSSLANADGSLRQELTSDGVHPNAQGYLVMAPLAAAAVGGAK
jgi:lysophospholipase L1-like esterase